jgi:hypothetical protein
MKTIKYIIAGAVLATSLLGGVSLTSCSDLDEEVYTFVDPASFYNTEDEIDATLVGVYNRFRNMYTANNQLYLAQIELLSDQGVPTYNKNNMELINIWDGVQNASVKNGVHRIWAACYETINRANIVLGRVDAVDMSDEAKNRIKGQAYFLRGYSFFSMARCFGALALPLTYTNGVEGLEIARSTYGETYDQIISDLKQAESLLPNRGTSGYDVWRASKGAAQAALGEVYLYRASMADVQNESANQTEYYTQARDYSKKVIDSNLYGLMDNYVDQFYWFNEAGAKNCKESIFELQFSAQASQSNGMHIRFGLGRTYSNYMGCYQYSRMGVSPYVYTEMMANGDKRAEVFLTYFEENDGTAHKFNSTTMHWEPYITNDRNVEHTCVFNCKYFDQHTDASLQRPNANFPILRYAEVLLNYAEAANILNGGSGIECLNQVRNRAGLPSFSGSQAEIDEEIFNQRRFEFVGEGKIFFDELRRDVLADLSAKKLARGYADGLSYFTTDKPLFAPQKSFLFLIPQSDLDSNPALEQNPIPQSR